MIIANKEKILLVEDDDNHKKIFKDVLESWGYWVMVADCKEKAFDILTTYDITKVILDYYIVGGTGIPILNAIERIAPDILVYANSGDPLNNEYLIQLGCIMSLDKDIYKIAEVFKK